VRHHITIGAVDRDDAVEVVVELGREKTVSASGRGASSVPRVWFRSSSDRGVLACVASAG
jgi:hypothetical protein